MYRIQNPFERGWFGVGWITGKAATDRFLNLRDSRACLWKPSPSPGSPKTTLLERVRNWVQSYTTLDVEFVSVVNHDVFSA